MNGYIAFYNSKRTEINAASLYAAKLEAIKVFRPPKSKEHMISVVLAEKNGEQVTHAPLF